MNTIMPMLFRPIPLSIVALFLIAGSFFVLNGEEQGSTERSPSPVEVVVAQSEKVALERTFTGVLLPKATTELSAKAPGRVSYLGADVGTRVSAGSVLVELDATTERAVASSLAGNISATKNNIATLEELYNERIKTAESPAYGGVSGTTGNIAILTSTALLSDQVSDTLGSLLGVRGGRYITPEISFDTEFGARSSAAKISAREHLVSYQVENVAYQDFFDMTIMGKSPTEEELAEGILRASRVLEETKSVLNDTYEVLLYSIVSVNLTERELSERKRVVGELGMQAEELLRGLREVDSGVAVLKKEKETQLAQLESSLVALRGEEGVAAAALSNSVVRSPYGGVITEKFTERGAVVAPGVPLLAIADDSTLLLRVGVPDVFASRLSLQAKALVEVDGISTPVLARVTKIAPAVDPSSRKVMIEFSVENPTRTLRIGSFARVTVSIEEVDGVVVPSRAVIARYGTEYVFVENEGVASRRVVESGKRTDMLTALASGVSDGERIIVSGNLYLRDGDRVFVATSTPPSHSTGTSSEQ